jgi:hypothetical protein
MHHLPHCVSCLIAGCATLAAADPWPGGTGLDLGPTSLTSTEMPLNENSDFFEMSDLHWSEATRTLWAADAVGSKTNVYAFRESTPGGPLSCSKRFALRSDGEGITQAGDSGVIYLLREGPGEIIAYDVRGTTTAPILRTWTGLLAVMPAKGSAGPEGLTFVPDAVLAASGFRRGSGAVDAGAAYPASAGGLGGIFLVAHQNGGRIHAVDLAATSNAFTYLGSFSTGADDASGLALDQRNRRLLILHNTGKNSIEITDLRCDDGYRLVSRATITSPQKGNVEGIAVTSCLRADGTYAGASFYTATDNDRTKGYQSKNLVRYDGLMPVLTLTSGGGQTGPAGASLPVAPVWRLRDGFGQPERDVLLAVGSRSALTAADGSASAGLWTLSPAAGPQVLTATAGPASAVCAATAIAAVNLAPVATAAPGITGAADVGNTLSADAGSWTDDSAAAPTMTWTWWRSMDATGSNAVAIGAGSSLSLGPRDAGQWVAVDAVATDALGASSRSRSSWIAITPITTWHASPTGAGQRTGASAANAWAGVDTVVWDALRPGHTLLLHHGSYAGTLAPMASGVSGAPVVIRPADGAKATFTATTRPAISVIGRVHLHIAELRIAAPDALGTAAVEVATSEDIDLDDLRIDGAGMTGIQSQASDRLTVRYCRITESRNSRAAEHHGVRISGGTGHRLYANTVTMAHDGTAVICDALHLTGCDQTRTWANHWELHSSAPTGHRAVVITGNNGVVTCDNSTIRGTQSGGPVVMLAQDAAGLRFANNTVVVHAGMVLDSTGVVAGLVWNSILWNRQAGGRAVAGGDGGTLYGYNLYCAAGFTWANTPMTWEEWRADPARDSYSRVAVDPILRSTTDLRLAAGSPAIDAGDNLTSLGISSDKNGKSRGSLWEIGAYRY